MGTAKKGAAAALFGRARLAILSLFYLNPTQSFYVREVMRRVPIAPSNVQRELKILFDAGLISKSTEGRQVYYKANNRSAIFEEVLGMIHKVAGAEELLREALRPFNEKILVAFIFGSYARGNPVKSSDVDLLVVGDISFSDLVSAIYDVQKSVGREINGTVLSRNEFRLKQNERDPFVLEVLNGPKLFLIGNADELASVA